MSSPPSYWNYSPFDGGNFRIHGSTIFFMVLFFSVVFLAVMLFLYSRRIRFVLSPPLPTAADDSPDHSAHPPTPTPRGLDAAVINSLPTVLCKGNGNDRSECCICLGIFTDGEKVRVLPHCYHRFHSECVDKWLKTQSSCPLCRDYLRVDSPV